MQPQSLGTEINHRPRRQFIFANVSSPDKIVDLKAGQVWAIKGRRRRQIVFCLKGRIWLTQENDIQDYVLEEGDAFLITRPGLVTVRALGAACIGYCEDLDRASTQRRERQTVLN